MSALSEKRLDVGNHVVRAITGGAGDRLVLVMASPLVHAGLYRPTAAALAAHTRVAVVDLPGSGGSTRVRVPPDMQTLSDYVPAIVQALDADSAILVGHSNSGAVAVFAALRHRDKVAGLVLADSVGAHPGQGLVPVIAGRAVDACIELSLTLRGLPVVAGNLLRHPRNFAAQVRMAAGDGLLGPASRVEAPTLLAWGRRDHTMPLLAAARFASAMPAARTVISDTGSHDWIIEEPARFAEAVRVHMRHCLRSGDRPSAT